MALLHSIFFYIIAVIDLLTIPIRHGPLGLKKGRVPPEEYQTLVGVRVRRWAKRQMINTRSKITVLGSENIPTGGVLFVSNHQSFFDFALFLGYFEKNIGFVSKIGVKKVPIVNKYMSAMRCIYLDRGNMRQNLKTILEGIEILKSGHSLVIFPEGSRNIIIDEFKAGSFKLATKAKVPIVPVTISDSHKMLKKGKMILHPATVNITIHPPIYTENITKEEEKKLHITVHEIIAKAL